MSALEKPHYYGHRKRLKERFLGNPQAVPDYELLELMLYWVYPRRDTKPLAKILLEKYKTLKNIIHQHTQTTGFSSTVSPCDLPDDPPLIVLFHVISETARRLLMCEIQNLPLLNNTQSVIDYCHLTMAHLAREQFRLFFLDKKYYLIGEDIHQIGTLDQVPLYPREVLKKALGMNAAHILMVHNHPSGDPSPSQADIGLTRHLRQSLAPFSIRIIDHFIIGKQGYFSFREQNLLDGQ